MVAAALIFLILSGGREETEVIVEIIILGRRRGAEAILGALEQRRLILKVESMDIIAAAFAGEVGFTTGRLKKWQDGGGVEVRDVEAE